MIGGSAAANEGVFLLGYDTVMLQRGNSGVASPRNASWMFLNPASIIDLERRLDLNIYTVLTDVSLNPGGLIGNFLVDELNSESPFYVPSGGVVLPTDYGTFALGLYVPSGSGVDYGDSRNILARLVLGNTDRRLEYQHIRLIGAYAREVWNGWTVGAALHGSVSRIKTDHLTLSLRPTSGGNEWDEVLGAGFGLGLYKNWDKWAVGLGYISRHWVQHFEEYEDLLAYPVDLPHIIQAGFAYRPIESLELNLDYKFLDWADVNSFGTAVVDGGFDWDSQHGWKGGIEWQADEKFTFRAGYSYANTPIDRDHVFVSTLVPVNTEDHFTIGFTYAATEQHEISFTYLHAFEKELTDSGRGDPFSLLAGGTKVTTQADSFSLGYSYKW
jgi:long-chain fatty acid transport protein